MLSSIEPRIKKAKQVVGKSLVFRNADVADANFILSLRTDSQKSIYLSEISTALSCQVDWMKKYTEAIDQAYFIIENQTNEKLGTVRIYNPIGDSFCWGSWILKRGAPSTAAIESALMVYAYAIDHLGFRNAHFEVHRANEGVWRFHERFGAIRIEETEYAYRYHIASAQISASRLRYRKYLPNSLTIEV